MRRVVAFLALLAVATVRPELARAVEQPPRRVGLHRHSPPGRAEAVSGRAGWLGVSVSLRDLFWPEDAERLRSGFVNRVVIRVELYREGDRQPLARQDRRTDILFDLWDERFRVRVIDRNGRVDQLVTTDREAVELATSLRDFQVAELATLSKDTVYRLRFRADLNPLSEDLVAEVRRWLVRPPGQGRTGAGDSFFGSFVSIFVNPRGIEESERQLTFWSQPFRGGGDP